MGGNAGEGDRPLVARPVAGRAVDRIIAEVVDLSPDLAAFEHRAARLQRKALAFEAAVILAVAIAGIAGEGPVAGAIGRRDPEVVAAIAAAGRRRRAAEAVLEVAPGDDVDDAARALGRELRARIGHHLDPLDLRALKVAQDRRRIGDPPAVDQHRRSAGADQPRSCRRPGPRPKGCARGCRASSRSAPRRCRAPDRSAGRSNSAGTGPSRRCRPGRAAAAGRTAAAGWGRLAGWARAAGWWAAGLRFGPTRPPPAPAPQAPRRRATAACRFFPSLFSL